MSRALSTYTTSRDNNFNLIRFVAALLVLYSHSFALALGSGDAEPLRNTIGMTWGIIAVDIFFITSGFLITSSYFARNNLLFFAWARILRIYPALIAAILFCVFIVGLWFTTHSAWEYLTSGQTLKFLLKNVFLFLGVEYQLPGVFANIPYKNAINGSLWTLPYEVKMYVLLAIILFVSGFVQSRFIGSLKYYLLFIAAIAVMANIINHFYPFASANFIHLFSMFFVGSAYYVWRDKVQLVPIVFILVFLVLLASSFYPKVFYVLYVICLPYLILYVAYVPAGWGVRNFNKYGDYSYGMYIYAFPVQQSISAMIPGVSVATMIIASLGITFFLSILSWHLIEKRFLKLKGSQAGFDRIKRNLRLTRPST